MTDRINSFFVVLEKDIREDDAVYIKNAIKAIRGVLDITENVSSGVEQSIAEMRVKRELINKILELLNDQE